MNSDPASASGDAAMSPLTLSTVAIKPPPFWSRLPSLWFDRLESQFSLAGIVTQKTKFDYVLTALDADIIQIVSDVVRTPHSTEPYNKLKNALISRLSASENSKINQLLSDLVLGDRRPSQLLREMRELAEDRVGEDFLRTLWLQRLPESMQAILACNPGSLSDLATCADKIAEVCNKTSIFTIDKFQKNELSDNQLHHLINSNSTQIQQLAARVDTLTDIVTAFIGSKPHQDRRNTSSITRNRSASRGNSFHRRDGSAGGSSLCWYHKKFGNQATKCITPCTFANNKTNLLPNSKN